MAGDVRIDRRSFVGAGLLAAVSAPHAMAQGFAGLGGESFGFAPVVRGRVFDFPLDHGAHPDFRIEWWYLTANLQDNSGNRYGAQWTLFRQAMFPGAQSSGWESRQIWMGHAAVTSADNHRYAERFARGGIGQSDVVADPFRAWIDSWEICSAESFSPLRISPCNVSAVGSDFEFALNLTSDRPLVLQGEKGYSTKSERGQASYYFSQPFFAAGGMLTIDSEPIKVSGQAWMDREWSSQPLAAEQTGWDWLSLHLDSGEKIMLFRLRQAGGAHYFAGNWIAQDASSSILKSEFITMVPRAFTAIDDRKLPTSWGISVADRNLNIDCVPLNPKSWMGTRFAYWEGPISFRGSHTGVGYLEMTGY